MPQRLLATWKWSTARAADHNFAPRWWWAATAVAAVCAVHAYVAFTTEGPSLVADEVSNIGASLALANGGDTWTLAGNGYMPGVALIIAPAWWLTNDPFTVYHVALAVGVLTTLACIWPLALLARAFGIRSTNGSVVVASVVMLAPARTVSSNYVLAESLLLLCTAWTCVAALRAARKPGAGTMAVVGLMSGLAFLAHGRGIGIVVGAVAWGALFARSHVKAVLALVAAAFVTSAAAYALFTWVSSHLYWHDRRLDSTISGVANHTPLEVAGTFFGLAWYAIAAWPAVTIVGFAVAARRARFDRGVAFIWCALVPTVVVALMQLEKRPFMGATPRLDAWIYGRYLDHVFSVVAVIGLACLVRVRSRAYVLAVGVVGTVVSALFYFVTVPQIPVGGFWAEVHVAGVSFMLSPANRTLEHAEPWLALCVAAIAISLLIAIAAVRGIVLLVLGLLWGLLSIAVDTTRVDAQGEAGRVSKRMLEPLSPLPAGEAVAFNIDYGLGINAFAFALHPRPVDPVTLDDAVDKYPAVYTAFFDGAPGKEGALPYNAPAYFGYLLWYYPGELFDELYESDRLLKPKATASSASENA